MKKLKISYKPDCNMAEFIPNYNHNMVTLANRCNKIAAELNSLCRWNTMKTGIGIIFAVVTTRKIVDLEMKVEKLEREKKVGQTPECPSFEEFMADCNEKEE